MNRFFETVINPSEGGVISLGLENSRHLALALRIRAGERVIVCDGRGRDYICETLEADAKNSRVIVKSSRESLCEPPFKRLLFQSLPKSDKMDFIIQKAVELGVTGIVPFVSEFSVARPQDKGRRAKSERYAKISEAAAKQCGRGIIPKVFDICSFHEAISESRSLARVIAAYENEKVTSLKDGLKEPGDIGVFIGPEGGFSEREAGMMKGCGILSVSLGRRILRTETAGLYVLSCIDYETEGRL